MLNCYTDQNPPKRLLNIWTFMYCTAQPPQSNTSQTKCCHQLFYSIYILRCTLMLNSSTGSSLRYFSFKTQPELSQFFNNSSVRFPANENFRKKKTIFRKFSFRISQTFPRNFTFFAKMYFWKGSENDEEFCEKKYATVLFAKNFGTCPFG